MAATGRTRGRAVRRHLQYILRAREPARGARRAARGRLYRASSRARRTAGRSVAAAPTSRRAWSKPRAPKRSVCSRHWRRSSRAACPSSGSNLPASSGCATSSGCCPGRRQRGARPRRLDVRRVPRTGSRSRAAGRGPSGARLSRAPSSMATATRKPSAPCRRSWRHEARARLGGRRRRNELLRHGGLFGYRPENLDVSLRMAEQPCCRPFAPPPRTTSSSPTARAAGIRSATARNAMRSTSRASSRPLSNGYKANSFISAAARGRAKALRHVSYVKPRRCGGEHARPDIVPNPGMASQNPAADLPSNASSLTTLAEQLRDGRSNGS